MFVMGRMKKEVKIKYKRAVLRAVENEKYQHGEYCRCSGLSYCPGDGIPNIAEISRGVGCSSIFIRDVLDYDNDPRVIAHRKQYTRKKEKIVDMVLELVKGDKYRHRDSVDDGCVCNRSDCPGDGSPRTSAMASELHLADNTVRNILEKNGYKFPDPSWLREMKTDKASSVRKSSNNPGYDDNDRRTWNSRQKIDQANLDFEKVEILVKDPLYLNDNGKPSAIRISNELEISAITVDKYLNRLGF